MLPKSFNEQLKTFRTKAKLSQNEIAHILHVSRQSVSSWETGRNTPDIETIKSLADIYNVSIDELVFDHKQSFLSKNDLRAQIILGIATGFMIMGRLTMLVSIEMRLFWDLLIIFSIILNVILFKKITDKKIMSLILYEISIFLSMFFNVFSMGIEGQMILVPSLIMFLLSTAFFVKSRRLFIHNIRRILKNANNKYNIRTK
ncbi:hypothetical protein JC2156_09980 [Weissella koreensis KCTC 3621]|uniref:helix-turn-helix domain-containing protein n=1 Tax=Weissella koreensis TaxID=165096 RepID=UPI00026F309F|nr:helix-turn-helix transcriptional regulator [Weissella koreensis]EJF33635.1 hypothetical protein JC2156_09980 [Weissella koreensis KCTC 3621]